MSQQKKIILDKVKQHRELRIIARSHNSTPFNEEISREFKQPDRRQNFYSMLLMTEGISKHRVDFRETTVSKNQLLFVTPWQIHTMELSGEAIRYGTSFGEELLEYIPSSFPFLINPLNNQIIELDSNVVRRLTANFQSLENVLQDEKSKSELVLTYLDAILTECNIAYFKNTETPAGSKNSMSDFIRFKNYLEEHFLEHPSIEQMTEQLYMNTNALFHLVKTRCGISPKNYLTERLILEAKRKLYFEDISIKELAFDLNYNDPEYFSRLFKKQTGKSIPEYRQYIQDLSRL